MQVILDGKSSITHSHTISEVSCLQAALNSKLGDTGGSISGSLAITNDLRILGDTYLASGSGLKVGYTEASATYGWRDIIGQLEVKGVGIADPEWTKMGASVFYAYRFIPNKEVWITYHIPHDYVPGSPVFFHTHWTQDGTCTLTVAWQYSFTFAKGFDQESFDMAGRTATSVQAGPGVAWRHMVSETDPITLTGIEVDSIVLVHLKRISHAGASNSDNIFVMTADIHYQSNNMATKNKAPNFYT